jgi:DNA invertase Pin-like site-specific DNA recombinase
MEQQVAQGQEDCAERDWQVAAAYSDGSSASRFATRSRSDWERLLSDVEAGKLDLIWLWESSRGDRELESWAAFLSSCRRRGVLIHVWTHERTYDVRRARDWKALAEDGVSSAFEVEQTSERVTRGVRAKALAGRPHGRSKYGYDRVYEVVAGEPVLVDVVENRYQADVIREAARRSLAGETEYKIACDFNARGVPTPRAGLWTAMNLRRVLGGSWTRDGGVFDLAMQDADRRCRAGESASVIAKELRATDVPAPATRWLPEQVKRLLIDPAYNGKRVHLGDVVADAMWPAILEDVPALMLRSKLNDPGRGGRRESSVAHLLTGIARCGRKPCDGRMRVLPNRGSLAYTCATCFSVSRSEAKVDWVIELAVVGFLSREDAAEILAASSRGGEDAAAALVEIEEKQARLDGWYDQAAAGKLSKAGLERIEATLLGEIADARKRARRAALARIAPVLEPLIGPDAAERWEELDMPRKREAIRALMRIRILPVGKGKRIFDPESVDIDWVFGALTDSSAPPVPS